MSAKRGRRGEARRLSTPLVLAVASAMICTGIVAWWLSHDGAQGPAAHGRGAGDGGMPADTDTPEHTAEAFLDAWRKRDHERALALSVGAASNAVVQRRAEDDQLTEHERALKEQVWDEMARESLHLKIRDSRQLEQGRLLLRGIAEGEFLDNPYRRRITFVLTPKGERWRVADMQLGEILTELPGLLELDPSRDPGRIEPQGEDVP